MPPVLKPFQTEGDLITHFDTVAKPLLRGKPQWEWMAVTAAWVLGQLPHLGWISFARMNHFDRLWTSVHGPNRNAGTRFRMSSCKQKVQWLPRNAEHSLRADRLSCCWWKSDSFHASNPIDNGIILNDIQYQVVPDFNHHKAMLSWLNDVFTLRIPNCVGPPALVAPLAQRASRWPAESDGFL